MKTCQFWTKKSFLISLAQEWGSFFGLIKIGLFLIHTFFASHKWHYQQSDVATGRNHKEDNDRKW